MGEAIRRLAPWISDAGKKRFASLAAQWAIGEGKAPLALSLAPDDASVQESVRAALRVRLLFQSWERSRRLALPTEREIRSRLLSSPSAPPSMVAFLKSA